MLLVPVALYSRLSVRKWFGTWCVAKTADPLYSKPYQEGGHPGCVGVDMLNASTVGYFWAICPKLSRAVSRYAWLFEYLILALKRS